MPRAFSFDQDLKRGALFAIAAAASFSITGVCIKAVAPAVSNEMIVFCRSFVSFLALLPWVLRDGAAGLKTTRPGGHIVRTVFGVMAMYCFFYAIAKLPLAAAMLLTYSTPLYVPFIAWLWIQERPPAIAFPAAVVGLIGIGFIVRPSADFDFSAGLVGLASGVLAACAMVSIRRISNTEPATRIVFYFAAMSSFVAGIPMFWLWQTPSFTSALLLIATGLSATAGQLCLTRAYAAAPAARVGPFTYFAVIFSALLAWALWGETLDRWFVAGAALVITTCVMVSMQRKELLLEE